MIDANRFSYVDCEKGPWIRGETGLGFELMDHLVDSSECMGRRRQQKFERHDND